MDNTKGCKWFFSVSPMNQDIGPNDAKFEIFKPNINSLIRESIQNSMDAVADLSAPVKMAFRISSFQRNTFESFFELKNHVDGCLDYWSDRAKNIFAPIQQALELGQRNDRFHYIEVSDYNTTGMDYEQNNNKTKFHGFIHSTGASNKQSENSGGSFGIGKAAYFAMSPIRSIMVSTMTRDKKQIDHHVFQGVSMLCTHKTDGELRMPIGFYSTNKEHPVTNENEIPDRFRRSEPGTSVYILGIQREEKDSIYEKMKKAVLVNFWLAIYNKRLVVTIGDEEISSNNIVQLVEQYFPELADNGRKGNINPRAYLELVINARPDNKEYILINENLNHLGQVKFYIHRHTDGRGCIQYFRMPNMMVKREKLASSNNFFGVFICDNVWGDKKLRQLESVAHDNWDADNWKPREANGGVSIEAKAIIDELESFIRDSINYAFGNNEQEVVDIAGLDRYLYIPTAADNDFGADSEALLSEPTGKFKEDGMSPTTILDKVSTISEHRYNNTSSDGKVYIGTITKAISSDDGSLYSGGGKHKRLNSTEQHIIPGTTRTNTPSDEGLEGLFTREVDVKYRGIAQKEDGKCYHYLLITSPEDIEDGRIVVETGLEYGGTEQLNIITSSHGTPLKNSIVGLSLNQGINRIKIKFADNLIHTISLKAYEDKQ